MLTYILFFVGFFILIKGADVLVSGASSIALRYKIPAIVVWLTIVAFGTSAPEFAVNIFSALQWKTDLAIGNIIGSNIANILLILWVAACIYPLKAIKSTVWKEIPFALLAIIIVSIVANDVFVDGWSWNIISRIDGFILLTFFVVFLVYTFWIAKNSPEEVNPENIDILPVWKSSIYIALGLIGLTLGGKWIVDWAVQLATLIWMSEAVIWLTVVAVWTSLPELATSVVAALKKQTDIAIGNVIGSNIFNVFWILGITAVVQPLPFQMTSNLDVFMNIFVTIVLFGFMFVWKKYVIEKWQWIVMILTYFMYITFIIVQNLT